MAATPPAPLQPDIDRPESGTFEMEPRCATLTAVVAPPPPRCPPHLRLANATDGQHGPVIGAIAGGAWAPASADAVTGPD